MSHYLVYWHQYWKDKKERIPINVNWSTSSEKMHETVRAGDWLWVIVSAGEKAPNEWKLLQVIKVHKNKQESEPSRWGDWHFIGDKKVSRVFSLQTQPDFAAIMQLLTFATGRRIEYKGKKIGQALQTHGFRALSEKDAILLNKYAGTLMISRSRSKKPNYVK